MSDVSNAITLHHCSVHGFTNSSLDDGRKLFRDFGIYPANLIELGAFAREADPTFTDVYRRSIVSLNNMTEMYTGKSLDKGAVRMSNWEIVPLTESQKTCKPLFSSSRFSASHFVLRTCMCVHIC